MALLRGTASLRQTVVCCFPNLGQHPAQGHPHRGGGHILPCVPAFYIRLRACALLHASPLTVQASRPLHQRPQRKMHHPGQGTRSSSHSDDQTFTTPALDMAVTQKPEDTANATRDLKPPYSPSNPLNRSRVLFVSVLVPRVKLSIPEETEQLSK